MLNINIFCISFLPSIQHSTYIHCVWLSAYSFVGFFYNLKNNKNNIERNETKLLFFFTSFDSLRGNYFSMSYNQNHWWTLNILQEFTAKVVFPTVFVRCFVFVSILVEKKLVLFIDKCKSRRKSVYKWNVIV